MGNLCTRTCSFCSVPKGAPEHLEDDEPARLAEAAFRLGLKHVVITIRNARRPARRRRRSFRAAASPQSARECHLPRWKCFTPDFLGDNRGHRPRHRREPRSLQPQSRNGPATAPHRSRSGALFAQPLSIARSRETTRTAHRHQAGLMLGIGETIDELFDVLADLRAIIVRCAHSGPIPSDPARSTFPSRDSCRPPSSIHSPRPARLLGFKQVVAGPYVRSSYHADDMVPTREGNSSEYRSRCLTSVRRVSCLAFGTCKLATA